MVEWFDHYSEAGWFEEGGVNPKGHINISVGVLVETDSDDYITLAQTVYEDGSTYADVIHILKRDTRKIGLLEVSALEDLGD